MLNTFERDLIADYRHADMLRNFAQHQRLELATQAGQATGFFATLAARLRGGATEAPIADAIPARA